MSIGPEEEFANYPILPTKESEAGTEYRAANGGRIKELGKKVINITTEDGRDRRMTIKAGKVHKVLIAAADIVDRDQTIVLSRKWGNYIVNDKTEHCTPIQRKRRTFVFKFKVREPEKKDAVAINSVQGGSGQGKGP